jgi:hypothetical protein
MRYRKLFAVILVLFAGGLIVLWVKRADFGLVKYPSCKVFVQRDGKTLPCGYSVKNPQINMVVARLLSGKVVRNVLYLKVLVEANKTKLIYVGDMTNPKNEVGLDILKTNNFAPTSSDKEFTKILRPNDLLTYLTQNNYFGKEALFLIVEGDQVKLVKSPNQLYHIKIPKDQK